MFAPYQLGMKKSKIQESPQHVDASGSNLECLFAFILVLICAFNQRMLLLPGYSSAAFTLLAVFPF